MQNADERSDRAGDEDGEEGREEQGEGLVLRQEGVRGSSQAENGGRHGGSR